MSFQSSGHDNLDRLLKTALKYIDGLKKDSAHGMMRKLLMSLELDLDQSAPYGPDSLLVTHGNATMEQLLSAKIVLDLDDAYNLLRDHLPLQTDGNSGIGLQPDRRNFQRVFKSRFKNNLKPVERTIGKIFPEVRNSKVVVTYAEVFQSYLLTIDGTKCIPPALLKKLGIDINDPI